LIPRVGVGSLSSPLEVGADRAPQAAEDLAAVFDKCGWEVIQSGPIDTANKAAAAGRKFAEQHVHAVALASASWFEDYLVLDLLEECSVPVLLWSLPGMETGALCGTQQLTAYLNQLGARYCCVYGGFDKEERLCRAKAFMLSAALKKRLRMARIGFAGYRVSGMTEVSADEIALKKVLGPRIIPLDVPQLLSRAEEMPKDQASDIWKKLVRRCNDCNVSEADGLDSVRIYLAVRELVEEHGLDALTVGCYPNLMGRVCMAASLLADEGVPLACEGDVNGAVGQLILTLLTEQPTHNTDWLEPLEDDTVIFSHCGSGSLSLAENPQEIALSPVRLMEQGICVVFPAKTGPVTLLNLLPKGEGYQCALLEGEALPTEMVFPGNPVRVRFRRAASELLDWIHKEGIGHHWMIGYGRIGNSIRLLASIVGPELRLIEP
jgi:L-fucose isomerase-like protein